MSLHQKHVSEFSPDGKLYATIDPAGKLKIWDTESSELKQEYTPNLHLSSPCTCFTWISVDTTAELKPKRTTKSIDHSSTVPYIALGTSKGNVSLYSYATAKIEFSLKGNGHSGPITSICRGPPNILYTTGDDCQIISWNCANSILGARIDSFNCGPEKPTCLAVHSNHFIVASREIKLYNIETIELVQTLTGHTSSIHLLTTFSVSGVDYIISGSKMDRVLSLWRLKSGKKSSTVVGTFLMEDVPQFINCRMVGDRLKVVATARSGVTHLYVEDVDRIKALKPIKPKGTVEIVSDNGTAVEPVPIVAATLDFSTDERDLLVIYGRHVYHFEFLESSFKNKRQIVIRNDPGKQTTKPTTADDKSSTVRGNKLKTVTPIVDESIVEYQTPSTVSKRVKAIEVPMETRLENLTMGPGDMKKGKNMAQLLVQGLHSHDSNILRTVFTTADDETIRLTLQRLPPEYVGGLVNELTLMAQKKTSNVNIAATWLKILIQLHSSQLMALGTGELYSRFGPILGIIEYRTNSLKELTKLSGRIDLLIGQIKQNTDHDDRIEYENLLVYEDRDTSDSDIDMMESSESDGQWEMDKEDGDGEVNEVDEVDREKMYKEAVDAME